MRTPWQNFWQSPQANRLGAWANAPPIPWPKIPVRVDGHWLHAPTFDRWACLWAWKLSRPDAFLLELFQSFCFPGCVAADLGANLGLYSLAFSRWAGRGGLVHAFEPEPRNFACLEMNLRAGGAENARPHRLAVGETPGTAFLHACASNHGDHRVRRDPSKPEPGAWEKPTAVQIVALDDFLREAPRLDVVKLDIQGNEGQALRGMRGLLEANPDLRGILEFWPRGLRQSGEDPSAVLGWLIDSGFRPGLVDETRKKILPLRDPESLTRKLGDAGFAHVAFAGKTAGVPW